MAESKIKLSCGGLSDSDDFEICDIAKYSLATRQWQGIPGISWADNNTLFATWYSGGKTEGADNYVLVVRSNDSGQTWSEPVLVIDPPGDTRAFDSTLWRDPAGRLWLFWAEVTARRDDEKLPAILDMVWDGIAGVWCSVCENPLAEELVWSSPRRICDGIMLNKPYVDSQNRWLLPVSIWNVEPFLPQTIGRRLAGVVASNDSGETFEYLGGAEINDNSFDEHMIFERDKKLYIWSRTNDGIAESISVDGGNTWSKSQKNGVECPNTRFCLRPLEANKYLLVNHIDPRMEDCSPLADRMTWYGRNNLQVAISNDQCVSWSQPAMLDSRQGVSYPDADISPDGTKAAVIYDYERIAAGEIMLAILTEDDVKNKKVLSPYIISKLAK